MTTFDPAKDHRPGLQPVAYAWNTEPLTGSRSIQERRANDAPSLEAALQRSLDRRGQRTTISSDVEDQGAPLSPKRKVKFEEELGDFTGKLSM